MHAYLTMFMLMLFDSAVFVCVRVVMLGVVYVFASNMPSLEKKHWKKIWNVLIQILRARNVCKCI